MKKNFCRCMCLFMAVFLTAGEAWAADSKETPKTMNVKQQIQWTDRAAFRAELEVDISGLEEWMDTVGYPGDTPVPENPEELPEASEQKELPESPEVPVKEKLPESPEVSGQEKLPESPEAPGQEELPETSETDIPDPSEEEQQFLQDTAPSKDTEPSEHAGDPGMEFMENQEKTAEMMSYQNRNKGLRAMLLNEEETPPVSENLLLFARISGYFQVDTELLSGKWQAEELMCPMENGEAGIITELTCPIEKTDTGFETVYRIPLILREEFRYPGQQKEYPVSYLYQEENQDNQEEEEGENWADSGTFLVLKQGGRQVILAKAEENPVLFLEAAEADLDVRIQPQAAQAKPGQKFTWKISVTNTGAQPFSLVSMEASLNAGRLAGVWESAQETDVTGQKLILTDLKEGETKECLLSADLPESLTESVDCQITVTGQKAFGGQESVIRTASERTETVPLKIDFSVSKSADRTRAAAGDTITYQICIKNTGERTLHSVLSAERFQSENIRAQFLEKDGVVLNGTKTQALISSILPGETVSLEAVVTLPETVKSGKLLNQVLVRTKETGEKIITAESGVEIIDRTPSETPLNLGDYGGGQTAAETFTDGYSEGYAPKTGDSAEPVFWIALLAAAVLIGANGAVCLYMVRKR